MDSVPSSAERPPCQSQSSPLSTRVARLVIFLLLVYLLVSYFLLPGVWRYYAERHPALEDMPDITHTGSGIPGDPLNVALVGDEIELKKSMLAAGWFPADPLTLQSCLKIAADTVLKRPYDNAPVSNLYLFGRKEDLAFEQPDGDNPRKRHHVRFWRTEKLAGGRPVWIGGATYDECVGLSGTTGQITHHIAADVDAERDHLLEDLKRTGSLAKTYFVDGFHEDREGRNGGGDRWYTDGRLAIGLIGIQ
jgi:hypothetical protein